MPGWGVLGDQFPKRTWAEMKEHVNPTPPPKVKKSPKTKKPRTTWAELTRHVEGPKKPPKGK